MAGLIFFLVCLLAFVVASCIMVWVSRERVARLESRVRGLEFEARTAKRMAEKVATRPALPLPSGKARLVLERIAEASVQPVHPESIAPALFEAAAATSPASTQSNQAQDSQTEFPPSSELSMEETVMPTEILSAPEIIAPVQAEKQPSSIERNLGMKLPVWLGGIALAMAGVFLVKYSIDQGWLGPLARVIMGEVFGLALLGAAQWAGRAPKLSHGRRVSQSLSGAGIVVLYASTFAATSLYGHLSSAQGLIVMAVITLLAVLLSLRQGAGIAFLGLIGGFLTPALVGVRELSTPLMVGYVFALFAGLVATMSARKWWFMAPLALVGLWGWVSYWMGSDGLARDSFTIGLFTLGTTAVLVGGLWRHVIARPESTAGADVFPRVIVYMGVTGGLVLQSIVVGWAGFGILEWSMFGLLVAATMALAAVKPAQFSVFPCIAAGAAALLLLVWRGTPEQLAWHIAAFALLTSGVGFALSLKRGSHRLFWSVFHALTLLSFFLLAYFRIRGVESFVEIPALWGKLAVALALPALFGAWSTYVKGNIAEKEPRQVFAAFTMLATALLSIAFTIELEREFLSVVVALEVLALAALCRRLKLDSLRYLSGLLMAFFLVLLLPQFIVLLQLSLYSTFGIAPKFYTTLPIVEWPLFQLGVPALSISLASIFLRKEKDDHVVKTFEVIPVALIAIMGYYLTRHAFHPNDNVLYIASGFFERGMTTNVFMLFGLACLWLGRRYQRQTLQVVAGVLCLIGMFRIVYFDLILLNPLWSNQYVGELPIVNALLTTYGLPVFWIAIFARHFAAKQHRRLAAACNIQQLVMAFVLVSLLVRQLGHGGYLNAHYVIAGELYGYSAAWALLGVLLLIAGAWRKSLMLRVASLVVMVLAIGKVFLYDAAALEGLYRVLSFFGLGVSLLGLSYLYARFVFKNRQIQAEDALCANA